MTDIAIKAEGLSKLYRIGQREPYLTLRDTITNAFAAPFRGFRNFRSTSSHHPSGTSPSSSIVHPSSDTIWALKEISFEVKQGEVIGIIGRNGAGKSTLLKILSRITEPTEGYADIYGRVGSLLEVGTGFHPELTGRENIYLNGAILGMKKEEIEDKFDEIVAFAEIEKFIDTPVKHYSSGMYLRLAFAVAAHLETEILLVDEVLAVGDVGFQKKCLGKMKDVAGLGRTVLLVSHQLNQIRRLCSECILIDSGRIRLYGVTADVVAAYEAAISSPALFESTAGVEEKTGSKTHFTCWDVAAPKSNKSNLLATGEACTFRFVVEVKNVIQNGHIGIALWADGGQLIWAWATNNVQMETGTQELVCKLPGLPLRPGVYHWQISLYDNGLLLDNWYCLPEFIMASEPQTHPRDEWNGILNLQCDFQINPFKGA
jgi:lipopolysaccharide transport system ATP-binding protein